MSRTVKVTGTVGITEESCYKQVLEANKNLKVENDSFVFEGYSISEERGAEEIVELATEKYRELYRELQLSRVLEQANKQNYRVRKQVMEDNTIKLVLAKLTH